jgi:hypothetical protein
LGQVESAWEAIRRGQQHFPAELELSLEQIRYLAELRLLQSAQEVAITLVERGGARPGLVREVADILTRRNATKQAIAVLEVSRLAHPDDPDLTARLGLTYAHNHMPLAAARLLEQAAVHNPTLAAQAAGQYLKARQFRRALHANASVTDQPAKLRQRVSILLQMHRFEEVAAMQPSLSRHGVLADQQVRYAVAYANYRVGRFQQAQAFLASLTTSSLVRKSADLRKRMAACADARCTAAR